MILFRILSWRQSCISDNSWWSSSSSSHIAKVLLQFHNVIIIFHVGWIYFRFWQLPVFWSKTCKTHVFQVFLVWSISISVWQADHPQFFVTNASLLGLLLQYMQWFTHFHRIFSCWDEPYFLWAFSKRHASQSVHSFLSTYFSVMEIDCTKFFQGLFCIMVLISCLLLCSFQE